MAADQTVKIRRSAGKRFVEELNHSEDELQANRKQRADLEKSRDTVRAKLDTLISPACFDTDITVATPSTRPGDRQSGAERAVSRTRRCLTLLQKSRRGS